jgi:hypothetical protein
MVGSWNDVELNIPPGGLHVKIEMLLNTRVARIHDSYDSAHAVRMPDL